MKIFWSWQSDTLGKTGRHFVRDCLKDAIATINDEAEVSEAPEQSRLTLDQDRAGVVGHQNLGDLIFRKIAAADLFVGDVTFVAELAVKPTPDNPDGVKRLINSNVAIEYGYAVGKLTDDATLLVMNLHYGPLTKLPFDLAYKIAPCRYTLAPNASKDDIAREKKTLTRGLVEILKLHVQRIVPPAPQPEPFQPQTATTSPAFFWKSGEVLTTIRHPHPFSPNEDDTISYTYAEPRSVFLRVMPTIAIPQFDMTRIMGVVGQQRLYVMTQSTGHKLANRNAYGAIAIEPNGSATTPMALSQIFRSGEIWGVSREFISNALRHPVVPMISLQHKLAKVLKNFIEVARDDLAIAPPYGIVLGVTGIKNVSLSLPTPTQFINQTSSKIFDERLIYQATLSDVSPAAQNVLIQEFLRQLYDLAGETYQPTTAST